MLYVFSEILLLLSQHSYNGDLGRTLFSVVLGFLFFFFFFLHWYLESNGRLELQVETALQVPRFHNQQISANSWISELSSFLKLSNLFDEEGVREGRCGGALLIISWAPTQNYGKNAVY